MDTKIIILAALLLACEPATDEAQTDASIPDAASGLDVAENDTGTATESAISPTEGSGFGHFELVIDTALAGVAVETVTAVTVAGEAAYGLIVDGDKLVVTVQGGPPGPAEIVLTSGGEETTLTDKLTYAAATDPVFEKIVGIGASLMQGVQRGTPSFHGGLLSPPAQLARHVGAYMPMPLMVPGLFPQLTLDDLGPPPACAIPDIANFITLQAAAILPLMTDPETNQIDFRKARIDPEIVPWNVAAGGSKIADVVHGPQTENLPAVVMSHMTYELDGGFGPVKQSQLDWVLALDPTLVMTVDLFGNDIISGIVSGKGIEPHRMTPLAEMEADLEILIGTLSETRAQVFLATMPDASLLPATIDKRRAMLAAGSAPEEIDALITEVDQRAWDMNAAMTVLADAHDNIHIVEVGPWIAELVTGGIDVGGTRLTARRFGGLLGLDGVHFTDTGYAAAANLLIKKANEALGLSIDELDLAAVYAQDVESWANTVGSGYDPTLCDGITAP